MSFGYTAATQYAYPTTVTRGAADSASPARVTTGATYDFNTGLMLSGTDGNGRTTEVTFHPTMLRPQTVTWSTKATTSFEYDAALKITEATRDQSRSIGQQTITWLNGLGLVRRTETLAREGTIESGGRFYPPEWDVVETKYDKLGRLWQKSRPFRVGEGPPPFLGARQTPQWSEIAYDALGRVTMQRASDGSKVHTYYNETRRPSAATFTFRPDKAHRRCMG